MNNAATKSEILAIIETLESMLSSDWSEYLLAERSKWCARLAEVSR